MSQNGMYELFKQSVYLTVLHFFLNWTVKTLISKCFISARVYVNMQT